MKISTSRNLLSGGPRGLQKFGGLLMRELQEKFNVRVVGKKEKSDIHLGIISANRKQGSKNILRVDGVYYDIKRKGLNADIRRCVRKFDGVVFQSKWCELFVTRMLKIAPKSSVVIHNGVKQSQFKNSIEINKYGFDKVFICCSHWRINKRLKSIVKSFVKIAKNHDLNLGLFVVGKPDYVKEDRHVKYFGKVDNLFSLYASSDYMCHICHLDACPNSVVEGLSAGLPVLCNNIGGTPEIVGDSGIILPLDSPFNFSFIDKMEDVGSSSIDGSILRNGMVEMVSKDWDINRDDLDISVAAQKYYNYFKTVLEN